MKPYFKILVVTTVIFSLFALSLPVICTADIGGNIGDVNQKGETIGKALRDLAGGGFGKAAFLGALLVGIFCLLFTKHRVFGAIVLVFGILLGMYAGGLGDSLWNWFKSVGGSGGSQ
jgi:hypothetical protein